MFPKMSDGPADSVQETMNFKQDLQVRIMAPVLGLSALLF